MPCCWRQWPNNWGRHLTLNKRTALVVALTAALTVLGGSAEGARASSVADPTTQNLIGELCRFKRLAQGGDLWPGYDPTKVPAVYLRARRGSLKPERSALFLGVVGARKFPGARVLRSPRCRSLTLIQARAPRNLRQAFTGSSAFTRAPLGGSQLVFAYLYGPRTRLTGSPLRRELLKLVQVGRPLFQETVIHELFHSFQFTNMRDPESDQDSWKQLPDDARFAALAVLESLVAARVDRAQGKEQIRKLARWFVSVRNARLSGSPAVRTFEEGQEWLEGTAQLVEDRASLRSPGSAPWFLQNAPSRVT